MGDYIATVQTNALAVKNTGAAFEEKLVVAVILGNLPEEYSEVATALDTLDVVTISKATAMLLNAEVSKAEKGPGLVAANHAMQCEINALKAEIHQTRRQPNGQSTCSVPFHRHAGGNDACYTKHPELRMRTSTKQATKPSIYYTVQRSLSARTSNHAAQSEVIADSGCSNHMFRSHTSFADYQLAKGPQVQLGDDSLVASSGHGCVEFNIGPTTFTTKNVLHVPALGKNLFSLGQSTGTGTKYLLDGDYMTIYSKGAFTPPQGHVLARVRKGADNLYRLSTDVLCSLAVPPEIASPSARFATQRGPVTRSVWHQRLGHVNDRDLDLLATTSATGIRVLKNQRPQQCHQQVCEPCILAKMTRFPFSRSTTKTTHPGEIIVSDLKGPFQHAAIDGGWRYFVTYVDLHTRFTKVYLLTKKNDQLNAFKIYEATICNKFESSIRCIETFQSDNGGEYVSAATKDYFAERGINHRTTVAYNPQSNGVAERINRTIMEIAESLRIQADLPAQFWSLFVFHAIYLLNRRPHAALSGRTPFEAWWGRKPSLAHLRVAGCDAWALTPVVKRHSQDHHARRGIFVGYAPTQKAYRLWDHVNSKIMTSQHVLFDESSFTFGRVPKLDPSPALSGKPALSHGSDIPDDELPVVLPTPPRKDSSSNYYDVLMSEDDGEDDDDQDDSATQPRNADHADRNDVEIDVAADNGHGSDHVRPERRYPDRARKSPGEWWATLSEANAVASTPHGPFIQETCDHIHNYAAATLRAGRSPSSDALPRPSLKGIMACDINANITLRQAISGPYGGHFSDAAHKEFSNLLHFRTWELRHLSQGRKAIGCKWVFKVKAKDDGTVDKFKARLVIQGFSQRPGIDYDETFAPVAHQESIRLLLALAAQHGYQLRHVDIVGAFLNGEMEEQVFMKQPDGFVEPGKEHLACELLKALYGLKQAGMVWNKRFNNFLVDKLGFRQVSADPCVYTLKKGEYFVILGVHVDDTLMVHNNSDLCDRIVKGISSEFEITDLGEPKRLLGMRIRRPSAVGSIRLDQHAYTLELLKRFNMEDCKPSALPHQPGLHLCKAMCPSSADETAEMKDVPYGELVGGLLWLSINTRPDIKQAVSVLCRFIKNPGRLHWTAAKLVLRYLRGTTSHGIVFSHNKESSDISGFADSDFANDPDKCRSVSGYVIQLANGPIAWKSKLQSSVATSSVHAEYVALYDGVREVVWLRQLLSELGHEQKTPTVIFEDNKGCISITANNRTDPRTKHIDVKFHYTREQVKNRSVRVEYLPTDKMLADALTKPVAKDKFLWFRSKIGVQDLSTLPPDVHSGRRVEDARATARASQATEHPRAICKTNRALFCARSCSSSR